jgi:hypothetical protein
MAFRLEIPCFTTDFPYIPRSTAPLIEIHHGAGCLSCQGLIRQIPPPSLQLPYSTYLCGGILTSRTDASYNTRSTVHLIAVHDSDHSSIYLERTYTTSRPPPTLLMLHDKGSPVERSRNCLIGYKVGQLVRCNV